MRTFLIIVVATGLVAFTLAAGGPAPMGGQLLTPANTKDFSDRFLQTLITARTFDAFQIVRSAIANPQADVDGMRTSAEQVLTEARNSYGRPIGFELLDTKRLGESFLRYDYLLRLERSALHFRVIFYKGKSGYQPVQLYFEEELDQLFLDLGK